MTMTKDVAAEKKRLIPRYSRLPLYLCIAVNVFCFQITRLFTKNFYHYDVSLPLDSRIPLFTPAVLVYVSCFATWAVSYVLIARQKQAKVYRFFSGEIIGKLIVTAIYIFFPTDMVRPEITGVDFFSRILSVVYAADTPDNLFPSLHCFASYMSWRGLLGCEGIPKWYRRLTFVYMFLVFAAVLLTKQHLILDVFAGVAVAELGLQLGRLTKAHRVFHRAKYGEYDI